jgi:hypothetical protein
MKEAPDCRQTTRKIQKRWRNRSLVRSSRVSNPQYLAHGAEKQKRLTIKSELQMQYSNFKDTLQNIASQIGNVEQEVEEHKYVTRTLNFLCLSEPGDFYLPTWHSQSWLRLQQGDDWTTNTAFC